MERAVDVHPQTQVDRQVVRGLPIVLRKQPVNIRAVFMRVHPAATKTERRSARQEILKVRQSIRRVQEENLSVERLREFFIQVDPRVFAAEAEHVRALHPAQVLHKVKIVLRLELVRWRRRSDLKT